MRRHAILGLFLVPMVVSCGDDTIYASGYSDEGFSRIKVGMAAAEVRSLVGEPLGVTPSDPIEVWYYPSDRKEMGDLIRCSPRTLGPIVYFAVDGDAIAATGTESVAAGMSRGQVERALGSPDDRLVSRDTVRLHFSEPSAQGRFNARIVGLNEEGKVTNIYRYTLYE